MCGPGCRELCTDRSAGSGRGSHVESSREQFDSFAHTNEPEPCRGGSADVESQSVIGYTQTDRGLVGLDIHGHSRRRGVLRCIVERFLNNTEDAELNRRREPLCGLDAHGEVDGHTVHDLEVFAKPFDGNSKTEVFEDCGPKRADDAADFAKARSAGRCDGMCTLARLPQILGLLDGAQADHDGGELLAELVVEVASKARSLLLLGIEEPAEQLAAGCGKTLEGPDEPEPECGRKNDGECNGVNYRANPAAVKR